MVLRIKLCANIMLIVKIKEKLKTARNETIPTETPSTDAAPTNAAATPSKDNDPVRGATKVMDSLTLAGPTGRKISQDASGGPSRIKLHDELSSLWSWLAPILGGRRNHPRVVIAFDEAHNLSQTSPGGINLFHILCRTISWFTDVDQPIWVVFASTNSRITDVSAPAESRTSSSLVSELRSANHSPVDPSARISEGGRLLFPPYTFVGWDQFAPSYEDLKKDPGTIYTTDNLLGFGRPL